MKINSHGLVIYYNEVTLVGYYAKKYGLLLINPMGCYKERPIWYIDNFPGVLEREFTVEKIYF